MNNPSVSEFDSVDPASEVSSVKIYDLQRERTHVPEDACLFALRNIGGKDAGSAAAAYSSKSALLKHEIAYVMGQMQDVHAVYLIELEDIVTPW